MNGLAGTTRAAAESTKSLLLWPPRKVIGVTVTVLGVVCGFGLLLRFYGVIFVLFVGIVLSIAIGPLITGLHRLRLSSRVAVIAVYTSLLLLVAGFVVLVVPLFTEQIVTIVGNLPQYYLVLRNDLVHSNITLIQDLAYRTPVEITVQPSVAAGAAGTTGLNIPQLIDVVSQGGFIITSVLMLAYYWTLHGERITRALLLRVPMEGRDNMRQIVSAMEDKVGAFLRGQAILCLSVGCAMLGALLIIQLPYALSLAMLAALFEAIPILGPTLGAVPVLMVALAVAPDKLVWVLVAVIIIQFLESNVLIPRIMDRSVGVNPVVSILAIIGFGGLLGLPGALLAIPLAAIIQVLISYAVFEKPDVPPTDQGRGKVSVLRYTAQQLQQDVRKQLRDKEEVTDANADQVEDLIEAIATDVDSLLAQRDNAEALETNP